MGFGSGPRRKPSNSVPWTRNTAVADGTNSFASVQQAVDAATSHVLIGPTVDPVSGELTALQETVVIDQPNITIEGASQSTILDGEQGVPIRIEADECTVRNITVRNDADSGQHAVELAAELSDPRVEGVTILQSGHDGIHDFGSVDSRLTDNVVEHAVGDGIYTEDPPGHPERTMIARNTISTDVSDDAIRAGGPDCLIVNNQITGAGDAGIWALAARQLVGGNIVKYCNDYGIRMSGDDQVLGVNHVSECSGPFYETTNATNLTRVGNNSDGSRYIQASEPQNWSDGDLWFDTS